MAAVAAPSSGTPPSSTVYVRNLLESAPIPTLIESLTEIFSEYGTIIDLIAKGNLRAKGQAFVVFSDVAAAERAIAEVQGFELFEKPMVLDYARTRSDATVKREGGDEELEAHKRRRIGEKEKKQALLAAEEKKRLKRSAAGTEATGAAGTADAEGGRPAKASRGAGLKSSQAAAAAAVVPDEYLPPNKILFVQNLPESYTGEPDGEVAQLTAIFGRFEGFKEVRLVPGRKGIAFVEYESEVGAVEGKEGVGGMTLGGDGEEEKRVKVTYQRQ